MVDLEGAQDIFDKGNGGAAAGDSPAGGAAGAEGGAAGATGNEEQNIINVGAEADPPAGGGEGGTAQAAAGNEGAGSEGTANPISEEAFEKLLNDRFKTNSKGITSFLARATEAEKLLQASPYKSPQGKAFDELLAAGHKPETVARYLSLDPTKMTDRDIITLKMQLDNPDLTDAEINIKIDGKYKLGDFKGTDSEVQLGEINLKGDAKDIRKNFDTEKGKLLEADKPSRANVQADLTETQRVEGWKPKVTAVLKDLKQLSFNLGKSANGKETIINYAVKNPSRIQEIMETVIKSDSRYTLDDAGIEMARRTAEDIIWMQDKELIVKTLLNVGASKAYAGLAQLENIDLGGQRQVPKPNGATDPDKQFLAEVNERWSK